MKSKSSPAKSEGTPSGKQTPAPGIGKKVAGGATGVVLGAVVGGPVGAVIGGVVGTAIGSVVGSSSQNSSRRMEKPAAQRKAASSQSSRKSISIGKQSRNSTGAGSAHQNGKATHVKAGAPRSRPKARGKSAMKMPADRNKKK